MDSNKTLNEQWWPANTYELIKKNMTFNKDALYFFDTFKLPQAEEIDIKSNSNKKNNNLYIVSDLFNVNTPFYIYGKQGGSGLSNLNLSNLHSDVALLHDDNVCNYVNHINSSNNLLVNFTLGNYQLTQTDNFKSKNSDTSLIDIFIPHDKKPGDEITIKDAHGRDINIRVPPGVTPGSWYSSIHTHQNCQENVCHPFINDGKDIDFDII